MKLLAALDRTGIELISDNEAGGRGVRLKKAQKPQGAREVGADQVADTFARLVTELAKQPPKPRRAMKPPKGK